MQSAAALPTADMRASAQYDMNRINEQSRLGQLAGAYNKERNMLKQMILAQQ